jgi:arylsulfatase A-like enzyme
MLQRTPSLSLLFIVISFLFTSCQETSKSAQPNIVFIMSDDHARQAVGCYDNRLITTPNIDRLASGGMRFANAFVTNAICAPSRAVILTGKYSHLNGLRDNRDRFDGSQPTFPKILQQAGYFTAIIGKWHLKSTPQGFDYWSILPGQGAYYNPDFIDKGDTLRHTGYTTDLITDLAIEIIKSRKKDQPFCIMVQHKAPHRNFMPDLKHLDLLNDRDIPIPETLFDDYKTRSDAAREQDMKIAHMYNSMDLKLKPADEKAENTGGKKGFDGADAWRNTYERLNTLQKKKWDAHYDPIIARYRSANLSGEELVKWKYQRYIKDYLRCVVSIDENVGKLLDYLDETGLSKNTMVVYTSDQGFFLGEHGWYDKRFMYEESASIPLIIRYPRQIKEGSVSDALVLNLDFAPTFLDYAGLTVPDDMQGKSLRAVLEGAGVIDWRDAIYYHYFEYPHGWHDVKRHYGIRTERYKLIHYYNNIDQWEMFDLNTDPQELINLYGKPEYGKIQNDLKQRLTELREHYQDDSGLKFVSNPEN